MVKSKKQPDYMKPVYAGTVELIVNRITEPGFSDTWNYGDDYSNDEKTIMTKAHEACSKLRASGVVAEVIVRTKPFGAK